LIEVNERLLQHPELLACSPMDKGYIAVIMITNLQKLIKQQNSNDDVKNDVEKGGNE
jgi:glycine cleavage system H lipoate-binding protein